MTEQVLSAQEPVIDTPVAQEPSVSIPSAPSVSQPAVTEKMLPQSEVGRIAGASRKEGHDKGYEKGYQEALAKFQQQQANSSVPAYSETAQAQNFPKTEEEIRAIAAKEIAESFKRNQEEQARLLEEERVNDYINQIANQLRPKIETAKAKYEDFDAKMQDLQLDKIPRILELVNSVPNAGEVLYDLANNPHKLGILNSLHTPELALREINRIAQSLQNNQAAQDKVMPKNPLSTIEPSTVGKQSGEMSGQQLTDAAKVKYRF